MRITLLFLTCALFLTTAKVFSQVEYGDTLPPRNNNIVFKPVSLIDFVNPCFEIGYVRKISQSISIKVGGGPMLPFSLPALLDRTVSGDAFIEGNGDVFTNRNKGYKANIEGRWDFWFTRSPRWTKHIAAEIFYVRNSFNRIETFETYSNNIWMMYDAQLTVHKERKGLNFKFGIQYNKGHFISSGWFGLGVQNRQIWHTGYPDNSEIIRRFYLGAFNYNHSVNEITPNLAIDYTIGYIF